MASYGDEEIVELLNLYKKASIGDVYSGIKIKGDLYRFHEYKFWDEKVSMMIPLRFTDMPEELVKVKYGHMPGVDILKCSRDYNIDIMLNLTEQLLVENDIEKTIEEQIDMLKMIQPTYEIYERGVEDNGYVKVGWFDYRASAMDIGLYCMNFIFSINGCMVLGKFSCNIYKANDWKTVILKMLFSINNEGRTLKEEKDGDR